MTFKHINFGDSVTMRALEKLAREKGLVEEQPIKKTAAVKKMELNPSTNLMENILNLCAGLRDKGFNKYADELETKFINYKQAQTLYETSKETGDDLVDAAHPKGSHKLEGVDGDESVVETILDQHMKLLNIVNKKPTGKLASSQEAIKAVKQLLTGRSSNMEKVGLLLLAPVVGPIMSIWSKTRFFAQGIKDAANALISEIDDLFGKNVPANVYKSLTDMKVQLSSLIKATEQFDKIEPAPESVQSVLNYQQIVNNMYKPLDAVYSQMVVLRKQDEESITSGVFRTFVASDFEDVQKGIRTLRKSMSEITSRISAALEKAKETDPSGTAGTESPGVKSTLTVKSPGGQAATLLSEGDVEREIANLTDWQAKINASPKINAANKASVSAWVEKQKDQLQKLKNNTTSFSQTMLNELKQENGRFYNAWVKPIL